ncbi:unnamed protein product [Lathyrus oleraceus]|uniref:Uncharacterized protein n=1 Tax=Pisum sativum TaxID=3888 RepID=A0A9D4X118_PEA|nr:uncharacterized protein LOC127083034 [Pisum sativum]KAI5411574.1 hypothetical protein KIW84_056584 [Pisum sativum]
MALSATSFIQMPLLRTTNYKSSPTKPMTITITCVNHKYKAKQVDRSRNGGYGPGPQTTSIKLQTTKTTTRNLQLDNIYATAILSSVNDEDDHNTSSPKRIGNVDYHYEI